MTLSGLMEFSRRHGAARTVEVLWWRFFFRYPRFALAATLAWIGFATYLLCKGW